MSSTCGIATITAISSTIMAHAEQMKKMEAELDVRCDDDPLHFKRFDIYRWTLCLHGMRHN
jgi:hypothetical protein